MLIPLPGLPAPCVQLLWPPKHPQEGPCQLVDGFPCAGSLVLLGGLDAGRELPGAVGQVLGILQG